MNDLYIFIGGGMVCLLVLSAVLLLCWGAAQEPSMESVEEILPESVLNSDV